MNTIHLFRVFTLIVMSFVCIANTVLKAQEPNYVTNEVKKGDLIVSKVIYRMDGLLYRHMKYDYTYDSQNRMTIKEAFKWNSAAEVWSPYFKITYLYTGNEITMEYARWNADHKAYDTSVEKSVYELNGKNMPVAHLNYKWNQPASDWCLNV